MLTTTLLLAMLGVAISLVAVWLSMAGAVYNRGYVAGYVAAMKETAR